SAGGELSYRFLLVVFADACLLARNAAAGLPALELAHEAVEKYDERILEPEIHRLRGELMLLDGSSESAAEEQFRTAMRIASALRMRSFELRAAMSLARLLLKQDKPAEAHTTLVPIYESFTEGFDTADLIDAKSLLAKANR
ncbi:MAG TPA: hypothetical protein VLL57_11525, partial [Candidatus Binataceae bacterium]|nr:hypothetical protein [Candidatus Binataceae bacterium]